MVTLEDKVLFANIYQKADQIYRFASPGELSAILDKWKPFIVEKVKNNLYGIQNDMQIEELSVLLEAAIRWENYHKTMASKVIDAYFSNELKEAIDFYEKEDGIDDKKTSTYEGEKWKDIDTDDFAHETGDEGTSTYEGEKWKDIDTDDFAHETGDEPQENDSEKINDEVNHPSHYTSSPAVCAKCGHHIEAIEITRHMNFNIGNSIKYLWRYGLKGSAITDLQKAVWYINDEIKELQRKEKFNQMEPWKQRVIIEKEQLDERLDKLLQFINTPELFNTIDEKQKNFLITQSAIMQEYSNILFKRLKDAK